MKKSKTRQRLQKAVVILIPIITIILHITRESTQADTEEAEGEYSITIGKGEIGLVKYLAIVENGQGHIANREGDKFTYRGPRPEMIYAFPVDETRGFTYKEWTGDKHESTLELRSATRLNIKIHILYATPNLKQARDSIYKDIAIAQQLWTSNGFGLTLGNIEIVDDRSNSDLDSCKEFTCEDDKAKIYSICSSDDDYLHIFYVSKVDGNSCAGYVCNHPKPHCVLACKRDMSLLGHEIGHTFGLNHPDKKPARSDWCRRDIGSDRYNAMWDSCMSPRKNFSLGQIIQSHMSHYSSLNLKCTYSNVPIPRKLLFSGSIECTGNRHIPSIAFDVQNPGNRDIKYTECNPERLIMLNYITSDCKIDKEPEEAILITLLRNESPLKKFILALATSTLKKDTITDLYSFQTSDLTKNTHPFSTPLLENQAQCIQQNAQHLIEASGQ